MRQDSHGQMNRTDLRSQAVARLAGAVDSRGPTAGAADALAVLHALASSPATAADALALLHELQVHQVELHLQAEELRESRLELESALRQQFERHDLLPVGCLTLDRNLRIRELNQAAAAMLGMAQDDACGLGLEKFMAPRSLDRMRFLAAGVSAGGAATSGVLAWRNPGAPERPVQVHLGPDPSGPGFLCVLSGVSNDLPDGLPQA